MLIEELDKLWELKNCSYADCGLLVFISRDGTPISVHLKRELAEHIIKLHNIWLEDEKESNLINILDKNFEEIN